MGQEKCLAIRAPKGMPRCISFLRKAVRGALGRF